MTADATTRALETSGLPVETGLVRRQIWGIFRLELRRNLLGRRAFGLYFMAFSPVLLFALGAIFAVVTGETAETAEITIFFAGVFQVYLRISIFLGALFMFMSAFRAEVLERSLHYYLLTPMRREVLVLGKYLTSLLATGGTFFVGTGMLYLFAFMTLGLSGAHHHFFDGPGLAHLVSYLGVSIMACIGYGALFLLAGLLFRNPVLPAVIIWGWEALSPVLPAFCKRLSVIFYLRTFYPVPVTDDSLFEIFAEPPSAWGSVLGILLFTTVVLLIAGWRARRMEINYGAD